MTDKLTHPIHGAHSVPTEPAAQQAPCYSDVEPKPVKTNTVSATSAQATHANTVEEKGLDKDVSRVPTQPAVAAAPTHSVKATADTDDWPEVPARDGATPETDAVMAQLPSTMDTVLDSGIVNVVVRLARTLERARDALQRKNAELRSERDAATRLSHGRYEVQTKQQVALLAANERADKAEAELTALRKRLDESEGYPGIAHDFETVKAELAVFRQRLEVGG